jgi:DNA-binding transcriptional MocR family regulator
VTIDELAYLKCPSKIRAAMINTTGRAPTVEAIRRKLEETESRRVNRWNVGEPEESDGEGYISPQGLMRLQRHNERQRAIAERAPAPPKRIKRPRPIVFTPSKPKPTLLSERVVREVCQRMDLDIRIFYSNSRNKRYVHARAIVCKVLRERNIEVYSMPRIGACICREDHSTVRHLLMNFDVYCRYPGIWDVYNEVRALDLPEPMV